MEQRNLKARKVRICDDVFFDLLHFLHRQDHQRINLVSRRLCRLSASVERRYPPRVIRALLVVGTRQSAQVADRQSADQSLRFVGNSMSACPFVGAPYPVNFATTSPPANTLRILEMEICDFIGPQLVQFLRVAAPLLDGCCLLFDDFENFVQFHSIQFIHQFFSLFPANRCVELRFTSSRTAPLFTHHPTVFGCTELGIECTADFPLNCLYEWLCQDALEANKRKCCLDIRFSNFVHVKKCLDSIENFVNFVRQRFLHATNWCPFCVEIELLGGPHIPELDPFMELNERTGEQLAFTRDTLARLYFLERRKLKSDGSGKEGQHRIGDEEVPLTASGGGHGSAGDEQAQHDVGENVYSMYPSMVFIRQILQGDIPSDKSLDD